MKRLSQVLTLLVLLLIASSCSWNRRSNNINPAFIKGFEGEGKFVWRGIREKKSDFYYVISNDGKFRMDFVTFWGQTVATLIYKRHHFVFYLPFRDILYRGRNVVVNGVSARIVLGVIKAVFWNERPVNLLTEYKNGRLVRFISKNGFIQGRVIYRRGIVVHFRVEGRGIGKIWFEKIKPLTEVKPSLFKLDVPDGVEIREVY